MEIEKIRNLTDEELLSQQSKSAEQLFRLRFQQSLGNTEGVKKRRGLRLDSARIKTVTRERTLSESSPSSTVSVAAAPVAVTRTAHKRAKKD